jgi:hypothetical protein
MPGGDSRESYIKASKAVILFQQKYNSGLPPVWRGRIATGQNPRKRSLSEAALQYLTLDRPMWGTDSVPNTWLSSG